MAENLKEKTARGLFWGGLSNTLQQLLGLIFGILLARQLSPDDYGMVGMLTVFSLLAGCIEEGGFTSAIAIKKSVSHRDYNAVFWFSILMSFVLYAILFFCAPLIAAYDRTPELVPLARVAFLGFVISSIGAAPYAMLFREMKVKERTIATFTATVFSGTVGVILAYNHFAYWGLVVQDLTFKLVGMLLFLHFSRWRPSFSFDFHPIREMFGFSGKLLATNVLNILNGQYLQALIGGFFPKGNVGLYTQANKWNTMGYTTIAGMVSSIAQPVLAQVGDERERQRRVFRKMLRFTAFLSFPAMFGLALIAPEFISLAIGQKWMPCVPLLQVLCVAGAVIPLSQLYTNLIISKGKSAVYLCSTFVLLAIQLIVIWSFYRFGLIYLLMVVTTLNVLWLFVWHFLAARETGLRLWEAVRDILPFLFIAIVTVVAAALLAGLLEGRLLRLLVKIVVAVAIYAGAMLSFRVVVFRECVDFLLKRKVK